MPYRNYSYDQLLKSYEELLLRVTRFASVEQELINTRDQLDQELVLYKRLQNYTGKVLQAETDEEWIKISGDAIVDILELECSLVLVRDVNDADKSFFFIEGCNIQVNVVEIIHDLDLIYHEIQSLHGHVVQQQTLQKCRHLSIIDSAIIKCFREPSLGFELFFLGGITRKNAASYNKIQDRHVDIFLIFAHQMFAVFSNRIRHHKIESQVKQISASEIELRKLSLIATKTKNGVIIADSYGRVEWINEAFTKISGYTLDDVVGKKPKDFLHGEETSEEKKSLLKQALSNKEDVETIIINYKKDGTPYYNQLEIISVFDEAGRHTHFIALQKDITEEIKSKQEIIKMNSRFEAISNTTHTGIWEWDIVFNQIQWNQQLFEILGVENNADKFISLYDEWKSTLHPDDADSIVGDLEKMTNGEHDTSRKEYQIIRKNDGEVRNCISVTVAERDENGKLIRLLGSMQDVTEQNKIQREILHKNEELQKINAELDHFVYSISHDLRSPLLSIKGIVSLVLKSPELREENIKLLNMTLNSASRLDNTIQEILEYSRNSRMDIANSNFAIDELIENVFDDLKFASQSDVRMIVNKTGSMNVIADKQRIGVLMKNIIGNSIKYRKLSTEAIVDVDIMVKDEKLTIVVIDNGEGIPAKHLNKVFDMFYRATTTSIGTGLGLYICKEIVGKLNGTIDIASEEGRGTTVKINLPL